MQAGCSVQVDLIVLDKTGNAWVLLETITVHQLRPYGGQHVLDASCSCSHHSSARITSVLYLSSLVSSVVGAESNQVCTTSPLRLDLRWWVS